MAGSTAQQQQEQPQQDEEQSKLEASSAVTAQEAKPEEVKEEEEKKEEEQPASGVAVEEPNRQDSEEHAKETEALQGEADWDLETQKEAEAAAAPVESSTGEEETWEKVSSSPGRVSDIDKPLDQLIEEARQKEAVEQQQTRAHRPRGTEGQTKRTWRQAMTLTQTVKLARQRLNIAAAPIASQPRDSNDPPLALPPGQLAQAQHKLLPAPANWVPPRLRQQQRAPETPGKAVMAVPKGYGLIPKAPPKAKGKAKAKAQGQEVIPAKQRPQAAAAKQHQAKHQQQQWGQHQ